MKKVLSDCNKCVWGTRDGGCASWECEFIDRDEAVKAWRQLSSAEPDHDKLHLQREQAYMQGWEDARLIYRQDAIDTVMKHGKRIPTYAIMCKDALEKLPSAEPDTTLLAQKIWTKVCLITDPEDANIQHEVIHYGDLKKVFLEVLGWEI